MGNAGGGPPTSSPPPHEGLDGSLIDPDLGTARPAWDLVADLLTTVSPALSRHGDTAYVATHMVRLRDHGTGAARQRRIHRRTGDIHAVLTDLAERTAAGAPVARDTFRQPAWAPTRDGTEGTW